LFLFVEGGDDERSSSSTSPLTNKYFFSKRGETGNVKIISLKERTDFEFGCVTNVLILINILIKELE